MFRPGWKLPLALGVAVGVGALLPGGWAIATSGPPDASFGTINAARINIVEPNGLLRSVYVSAAVNATSGPCTLDGDGGGG